MLEIMDVTDHPGILPNRRRPGTAFIAALRWPAARTPDAGGLERPQQCVMPATASTGSSIRSTAALRRWSRAEVRSESGDKIKEHYSGFDTNRPKDTASAA